MSLTPSDTQNAAIKQVVDWFQNRTEEQQVFRLFGYAGTGKSTTLKYALEEMGLSTEGTDPDVLIGTFTGKASLVLRRKGTPAATIHSLAYSVFEATEEEMRQLGEKIEKAKVEALSLRGADRLVADAAIVAMEEQRREMKRPRFALNPDSPISRCKLLVLDEVSMVGPEMAADLLSFGKPVLVLGDPGQLPPIKGEGAFTQAEPDVMLTEIHRQAGESAVIRLATMARHGDFIPFGQHDEFVWKMNKSDVTPSHLLRGAQVICGLNATRLALNNAMRQAAGFASHLPAGRGEKIICLRNQNDVGLINGMFIELDDVQVENEHWLTAAIREDDGTRIGTEGTKGPQRFKIYRGHFEDHVAFDRDRGDRDWKVKRTHKLVEATFGWAITCHKAQGSGFDNVIVWDEHFGRTDEDRRRWLYTAITRAEQGLVILA